MFGSTSAPSRKRDEILSLARQIKLLTQVESNPDFWVIQWSSFAMLLLGQGLQRSVSSHPRAGKTAGEIQTSSFPTWTLLGDPERIPKARTYTPPSPKHSCVQLHTCLLPLAVSVLTHGRLGESPRASWSGCPAE